MELDELDVATSLVILCEEELVFRAEQKLNVCSQLYWDAGSSAHVTDFVSCLIEAVKLDPPIPVKGVGGVTHITWLGKDPRWMDDGLFAYIEGIPEEARMCIRSVAVWCEPDDNQQQGFMVFGPDGAFCARATPDILVKLRQLHDVAEAADEGYDIASKTGKVFRSECKQGSIDTVLRMMNDQSKSRQPSVPTRAPTVDHLVTAGEAYVSITPLMDDETLSGYSLPHVVLALSDAEINETTNSSVDELSHVLDSTLYVDDELNYNEGKRSQMVNAAMCNLYGNRIKFNRRSALLQLLCDSGFSRQTLLDMLDRGTTGIPAGLTRTAIDRFFQDVGAGPLQDMATITKHRRAERNRDLHVNLKLPGKLYQFDAFEVPFAKAAQPTKHSRIRTVPSFNGHKVVAVAIDVITMAATLVSGVSFKHPEKALLNLIDQLSLQGVQPIEITADKQFVTPECRKTVYPATLRQSVPGAHDIWTPDVEGAIRWIKEMSLYNYNRAAALVTAGVLTQSDCTRLWLYMVRLAVYQWNLRTSSYDESKTRLEHIENRKFNMFTRVILPFAFQLTAKALKPQADGNRGVRGIYLLPSIHCDTGFHFYNLKTRCVNIVHAVRPDLSLTNRLIDTDLEGTVRDTLGEFLESASDGGKTVADVPLLTPGGGLIIDNRVISEVPRGQWVRNQTLGPKVVQTTNARVKAVIDKAKTDAAARSVSTASVLRRNDRISSREEAKDFDRLHDKQTSIEEAKEIAERIRKRNATRSANVAEGLTVASAVTGVSTGLPKLSAVDRIFRKSPAQVKSEQEMVVAFAEGGYHIEVEGEFPVETVWMETVMEALRKEDALTDEPSPMNVPRPPPFKRSDATSPTWRNADLREIHKIMAEDTCGELPKNEQGLYIEPPNAIHQRLLKVREWKWKAVHPETKLIVIDGSTDVRPDTYYALCPDRVLLFLLLSSAATSESALSTSDVERA